MPFYIDRTGAEDDASASDSDRRKLHMSIYALRRLVLLAAVPIDGTLFIAQTRVFDSVGLPLLASAGMVTAVLDMDSRLLIIEDLSLGFR